MPSPLGLIAGQGRLPVHVARGAAAAGRPVMCVGLRDQFADDLPPLCAGFKTAGIIQIGRWIRLLRRFGCDEAVMVGRVAKLRIYDPWRLVRQLPDLRAARLWYGRLRHDKRNDAILTAVADELARAGITLIDSTRYIPEQMATLGVMTRRTPSAAQLADVEFALPIVSRMGDLDVGQSVAVHEREVIAVEAIEGTDRMIERAGLLCKRGGWTLVKVAKPRQDMRFDVPTIGLRTIEKLKASGASCLALEAGKVIVTDKADVIAAADAADIVMVGVEVRHA